SGARHVPINNSVRAGAHIFLRALASIAEHYNSRADFIRRLHNGVEVAVKPASHHQNCGAEFVESHKHLLRSLRLRNDAHLVFYGQHLGDARAKNSLVVGQNEFQHWLSTSRLRLTNKIVSIDHTSYALSFT